MANDQENLKPAPPENSPVSRPNEAGTIKIEAHMRIFDPKTGKTLVEGRA